MIAVSVQAWSAWSPGIEGEEAWRQWACDPKPLERDGSPKVNFVPAMLRRRCDQLSRMMLYVTNESAEATGLAQMRSVFASRYGSLSTMISMLEELAVDDPLSPARFSHSVHNTQAGLFSIYANNREASTSIAARQETFAHGFLEAVSVLHAAHDEPRPVLLVAGDAAIPDIVGGRSDAHEGSYALALVLAPANGSGDLELSLEAGAKASSQPGTDALLFLSWFLRNDPKEPRFRLVHPKRTWVWTRAG